MREWQESLLSLLAASLTEEELFVHLSAAARILGFSHWAFGIRKPYPFTGMNVQMRSDYPAEWKQRYVEARYVLDDPSVLHCLHSQAPVVWTEQLFSSSKSMWREAQDFGLRVGWAQSNIDMNGTVSMLTLARSHEQLSSSELSAKEDEMRWFVSVSHMLLVGHLCSGHKDSTEFKFTTRELEVLKWTADGKTAAEISDILGITHDTVNFHLKKVICRLHVANKTAAVARVVAMGLLR